MQTLDIQICNSVEEAPNYNTDGQGFKGAKLIKAIVVRDGTEGGHDTVDLQFETEDGQKFIAMTTGRLLKTVTNITR